VEWRRSLTLGLALSLHKLLLEGVPEEPNQPKMPGHLRPTYVKVDVGGTGHLEPLAAWRLESALSELLESADEQRLPGDYLEQAARFHYRFVQIHPFCDGNGRMARALTLFLIARHMPRILRLSKPVNEVLWEHREDYIKVLGYCDRIYADLRDDDVSEGKRLQWCEEPFVLFHSRAVLRAFDSHMKRLEASLIESGAVLKPSEEIPLERVDLRFEAIQGSWPWDEGLKKSLLSGKEY
jgi:hypothetical protein